MTTPGRAAIAVAAAVAALGLARHAPFWDEPWGREPGAINGSWYAGQPVRSWLRLGFGAVRGAPLLAALPTTPPIGTVYAHHPPLFPWAVYACVSTVGWSEKSFRIIPVVCSALSGALIVLLAAPRGGLLVASGAGLLWLVFPMSVVYGLMCNPESPTLFFMLLALFFNEQFRDRGLIGCLPAVAAQFVAGQMDWQGHFAVPAAALLEVLRPRGARRFGRIVALGCASLFSAAAVLAMHGFIAIVAERAHAIVTRGDGGGLPRFHPGDLLEYLAKGVRHALRTASGSVQAEAGASLPAWLGIQLRNVNATFTPAVAVLVAVAVPSLLVRRTRALDLAVALLVPGLLNVLVFRRHAGHEFWLYYAAPGAAVTVPALLAAWVRKPVVPAIALAVVAALAGSRSLDALMASRTTEFRDAARELDALLDRPDDILVCDDRAAMLTFSMSHWVVAQTLSFETLREIHGLKRAGRIRNALVFLVAGYPGSPWAPADVEAAMRRFGAVRSVTPDEVAARMPAVRRVMSPGPLWLVRVE